MKRFLRNLLMSLLVISFCLSMASCKKDDAKPNEEADAPLTYEEYQALSPEERRAYYETFEDYNDFFAWYNNAIEKYKEENPGIELDGDIEIDIGGMGEGDEE